MGERTQHAALSRTGKLSYKQCSLHPTNSNILFFGQCQKHAVRMVMTFDDDDSRGEKYLKNRSVRVQTLRDYIIVGNMYLRSCVW